MQQALIIIGILLLIFWLVCISNILTRKDIDEHLRLLWLIVLLVSPIPGVIIYLTYGPKEEAKEIAENADLSHPIACAECGAEISAEADTCNHCGWTYK